MLLDTGDYPDPNRFNPDRLIGQDGQLDPAVRDPSITIFGLDEVTGSRTDF